ncbi:MAG: Uncharacterised protein [Euryarchaeota archaeon UBA443]|nr:MAG: Uncharacterised protein [Euryarchaeota archaeon UBA443]
MREPFSAANLNRSVLFVGIPSSVFRSPAGLFAQYDPTDWKYNLASGAIPLMFPEESVPSPRTEPATWVPCPSMSSAPSFAGDPHVVAHPAVIGSETISTM